MAVPGYKRVGGKRGGRTLPARAHLGLGTRNRRRFSNMALFTPDMLPGLLYWYDGSDASTLTQAGGQVSQINDKSGNGRHLTQATGANQPTTGGAAPYVSPNGKTGLSCIGSQFLTNVAVSILASDITSFASGMMRVASSSGARILSVATVASSDLTSGGTVPHLRNAASPMMAATAGPTAVTSNVVYDQWFVHSSMRLAAELRNAVDGAVDTIVTASVTAATGTYTRIALGTNIPSGAIVGAIAWTGAIGETFAFNRQLNATEYAMCQGYLAWRWGTQALLPVGHPWALRAPPALAAFSPEQLSGLLYWYDAADTNSFVLAAGTVSQINDKSGNNLTLLQGVASSQPNYPASTSSPNGRSAFGFSGGRCIFNEAINLPIGDVTSFMIGRQNAGITSGARALAWARAGVVDATANGTLIHYRSSTLQVASVYGGTGFISDVIVYDQWYLQTSTRLSAEVRTAVNGAVDQVQTVGVTAPLGPITRICMGCSIPAGSPAGTSGWLGPLGEIFGYGRLLTALEKQYCEGYAAWKWGTQASLAVGHAFILRAPYAIVTTPGLPPTNSVAPAVTPTTNLNLGVVLTTTNGTWANSPTVFTYQWTRDGSAIGGATSASYTLVTGDNGANIVCQVTAANTYGSAMAPSNSVGPTFTVVPVNTVLPVVTGNLSYIEVGNTLTCSTGTWSNTPSSYAYAWSRNGTPIGVTTSTYTLVAADSGANMICAVTASNVNGAGIAVSSAAVRANWSPLVGDITGLIAYYDITDPAMVTASGGFVSQISDKSPNAYHLTQSTGANQPSLNAADATLNNLRTISCVSPQHIFTTAANFNPAKISSMVMVEVLSFAAMGGGARGFALAKGGNADSDAGSHLPLWRSGTNNRFYAGPSSGVSGNSGLATADGEWHSVGGYRDDFVADVVRDGGVASYSPTLTNVLNGPFARICIAANFTSSAVGTNYWNGSYALGVLFGQLLSAANRDKLSGWAHWKVGLQSLLPSGHTYKAAPP